MDKKGIPGGSDRRWLSSPRPGHGVGGRSADNAAWNHAERRGRMERRVVYDRRQLIRFEDDRRVHLERRSGADPWAFP